MDLMASYPTFHTNRSETTPRKINDGTRFRLSLLLAGVILMLITLPSIQAIFGYRLFRYLVPLFFVWALVIKFESPRSWANVLRYMLAELVVYSYWCTIVIVYAWMNNNNAGIIINETMGSLTKVGYVLSLITICYLMGMVYATETDGKALRGLVRFMIIAVGLNALLSIPALFNQVLAVRAYINSYQVITAEVGTQQGVSIYGLGDLGLYMIEALLVPYLLATIIEVKGFVRLIYIGLFAAFAINIFMCSLLLVQITFILAVVLTAAWQIIQIKATVRMRLALVALLILLFFIGVYISNTESMQYSFNRVVKYLNPKITYRVQGDTYEARMRLYLVSLNTFIKCPFLGSGFALYTGKLPKGPSTGGHSGILDGFAMYGLLFSFYLTFLWMKYRYLRKLYLHSRQDMWLLSSMICFLIYMIQILFDPMIFSAPTSGIFLFAIISSAVPKLKEEAAASGRLFSGY